MQFGLQYNQNSLSDKWWQDCFFFDKINVFFVYLMTAAQCYGSQRDQSIQR